MEALRSMNTAANVVSMNQIYIYIQCTNTLIWL